MQTVRRQSGPDHKAKLELVSGDLIRRLAFMVEGFMHLAAEDPARLREEVTQCLESPSPEKTLVVTTCMQRFFEEAWKKTEPNATGSLWSWLAAVAKDRFPNFLDSTQLRGSFAKEIQAPFHARVSKGRIESDFIQRLVNPVLADPLLTRVFSGITTAEGLAFTGWSPENLKELVTAFNVQAKVDGYGFVVPEPRVFLTRDTAQVICGIHKFMEIDIAWICWAFAVSKFSFDAEARQEFFTELLHDFKADGEWVEAAFNNRPEALRQVRPAETLKFRDVLMWLLEHGDSELALVAEHRARKEISVRVSALVSNGEVGSESEEDYYEFEKPLKRAKLSQEEEHSWIREAVALYGYLVDAVQSSSQIDLTRLEPRILEILTRGPERAEAEPSTEASEAVAKELLDELREFIASITRNGKDWDLLVELLNRESADVNISIVKNFAGQLEVEDISDFDAYFVANLEKLLHAVRPVRPVKSDGMERLPSTARE